MGPDLFLGIGATAPVLRTQLKNPDGTLTDLTGATGVIEIRDLNHARPLKTAPVIIPDVVNSIVGYDWSSDDSAIDDWYHVRIYMTLASGKIMPWPDDRRWLLRVTPRP